MFLVKLQPKEILHVHQSLLCMDIIILIAILAFLLPFLNMVNKMAKWNTCSYFYSGFVVLWMLPFSDIWFHQCYFCRSLIFRLIWNTLSFHKVLCRYLIHATEPLWLRGKKDRKSASPTDSGFLPPQLSIVTFKWPLKHLGEIPRATESPIRRLVSGWYIHFNFLLNTNF